MSMESKPQVVLSVDDNDVDGALLERAFKRTSIPARLFRVSEGPQAMAYLSGDGIYQDRENYPLPDLVLLDLAMPKMSGIEVLKWIRDQPQVKRTKVLIFTSSEKPEDYKSANEIGADGYFLKPTKFDDLKNLVKQIQDNWLAVKSKKLKTIGRKGKDTLDDTPGPTSSIRESQNTPSSVIDSGSGAIPVTAAV